MSEPKSETRLVGKLKCVCGSTKPHFVSPSFGDVGFYVCEVPADSPESKDACLHRYMFDGDVARCLDCHATLPIYKTTAECVTQQAVVTRPYSELRAKMSPESRQRAQDRTEKMLAEMDTPITPSAPEQRDGLFCGWCETKPFDPRFHAEHIHPSEQMESAREEPDAMYCRSCGNSQEMCYDQRQRGLVCCHGCNHRPAEQRESTKEGYSTPDWQREHDSLLENVVRICLKSRAIEPERQAAYLRDELLSMCDPLFNVTQRIIAEERT